MLPLSSFRFRALAALALGAMMVAGFAPLEWFPLPILSLAGLCLLWQGQTPRRAAGLGFLWGAGCFLAGVSWIYVSLHDVGGMVWPLAAGATLLFCAYLALFPGLVGYGYARWRRGHNLLDALLLASLWCIGELLRGYLFTGFPWLALGYSQTAPSPLAGYGAVLGSYGLGWLVALLAGLLVALTQKPGRVVALVLAVAIMAGGAVLHTVSWTDETGDAFSVSLLQGNIPQSLKWDPERLHLSMAAYLTLAQQHPADLVVLPETAIPLFLDRIPQDVLAGLTANGPVLLGAAAGIGGDDYINAAVLMNRNGDGSFSALRYAKRHLVPFGEYIPPGFAGFLQLVNIPLAGFTPGPAVQPPLPWRGQQLMPNICYEDLFGEEIREALRSENAATVLINLSNTAWFGHSLAQPQHLQIARLRAMETGRPMLRATNTGMTAVIAADGTVTDLLPPFTQGALQATVRGRTGLTPYDRWGNAAAFVLAALGLLLALTCRKVDNQLPQP